MFLALNSFAALIVLVTNTSTTAAWKLAARSATGSGFCGVHLAHFPHDCSFQSAEGKIPAIFQPGAREIIGQWIPIRRGILYGRSSRDIPGLTTGLLYQMLLLLHHQGLHPGAGIADVLSSRPAQYGLLKRSRRRVETLAGRAGVSSSLYTQAEYRWPSRWLIPMMGKPLANANPFGSIHANHQ